MSGGGGKKSVPQIPSENTWLANPVAYYREQTGRYPSNAQMWWAFKRPAEVGTDRPPKGYLEVFDPGLRHQVHFGNTPAPRGHYILDAFQLDRSGASGVPNLAVESSRGERPSVTAFYAGRVFYAGVNTQKFNTKIYFSQILERDEQIGQCYQSQDPTSEDLRELLPTDGGVIVINDLEEVHYMHQMGQELYVFASNGVWQISGSEGIGFRANDYSVSKLSGTGCINNMSFVSVEGSPMWWNRSGIHALQAGQMGMAQVQSLTDETIKSFYQSIPEENKFYAKGAYDSLRQIVQWVFRRAPIVDDRDRFKYDSILVLDVRSGAWYPWELPEFDRVDTLGIFAAQGFAREQEVLEVLAGIDPVFVEDDAILSIIEHIRPVQSKIKYIVNVKPEQDLPPPPDPIPVPDRTVYVLDNEVMVNALSVQVPGG